MSSSLAGAVETIMKELQLPPVYCSAMCGNALNDLCIEKCDDMSEFEMKKGMDLADLPRFPLDEFLKTMSAEERKIIMAVYMAKTADYLQGYKNDYQPIIRRPNTHSQASSGIPTAIESKDLLHASETAVTLFEIGEERPSETVRPDEMAGTPNREG